MKLTKGSRSVDSRTLMARAVSNLFVSHLWQYCSEDKMRQKSKATADELNRWLLGISLNNLTENQLIDLGFKEYEYNSLVNIWLVPLYLTSVISTDNYEFFNVDGTRFLSSNNKIYPEMSEDGLYYPFGVLAVGSDDAVEEAFIVCPSCSYIIDDFRKK